MINSQKLKLLIFTSILYLTAGAKYGPLEHRKVCFPEVGCFDNEKPFDNAYWILPNSPADVGTRFDFFTRNVSTVLSYSRNDPMQIHVNTSLELKVVIHGFGQSAVGNWVAKMKGAFLKEGDFNVLLVDWKKGAAVPHYVQATANTRLVARQTVLLIKKLRIPCSKIHIIGHSLGAHIAGYIGTDFKGTIQHITGLDPADPLFAGKDIAVRLDPTDAKFVDVIHTNGKSITGFGDLEPAGHADFYVNGGAVQPGCKGFTDTILDAIDGNVNGAEEDVACSHGRAHDIYLESIPKVKQCSFRAFPCQNIESFNEGDCFTCIENNNCLRMGYYVNQTRAKGKAFIKTRKTDPYCGYHYKFEFKNTGKKTYGSLEMILNGKTRSTSTLKFFESDSYIEADSNMSEILVSADEIKDVESLDLTFIAHNEWIDSLFGYPKILKADNITILTEDGKEFSFCGEVSLQSGKMSNVKMTSQKC